MLTYSKSLARLVEHLQGLPGIGPKSAQRIALHLLSSPSEAAHRLAEALVQARDSVRACKVCFNYSDDEVCPICSDPRRDQHQLCVVARPTDLMAIERSRRYSGLYHVLQGLLSPMEGIGPENIRVGELFKRLRDGEFREVVLAVSPTVEGDATALHLAPLLKKQQVKVTRLALGIPAGGDLDYADQLTVAMALEGRREL